MSAISPTFPSRTFDVRIPFAGLLGSYVVFGLAWLGFARSPGQALLTVAVATLLDFAGNTWLRKRRPAFPWSGFITGSGLCLLLNYGSHPWLPILPAFLAIASKHIFTVRGRHIYNPTLFGLVAGGMLSGGLISPAPAYQWHGSMALVFVLIAAGCMIFVFRIQRTVLITTFLGLYMVQMLVRAWLMRHHVPPEAIIFGTLSSPPFFLFTFYMLTDPATSPKGWKAQLILAVTLVMVDFVLHTKQSYSTLFPALFMIQTGVLAWGWGHELVRGKSRVQDFRAWLPGAAVLLPCVGLLVWIFGEREAPDPKTNGVVFTPIPAMESGLVGNMSPVLEEVDPRVQHIAKWVFSVGDAVATADVDGDGLLDVFLTQPLKLPEQRAVLYHNEGDFRFVPIPIPALDALRRDPATYGLPSFATFADWDNDGDQDLFLGMGFGASRWLRNEGECHFVDVTEEIGQLDRTTCLSALFVDLDQDANLDLIVGNAMAPYLPDYDPPQPLNLFSLPEPEYEGDRRMFHFMHASWHQAVNGGRNVIYRNNGERFESLDAGEMGMPQTHWTLALNAADFDGDAYPDVYAASDFGPDDFYYNNRGESLRRHQGKVFGSVGKDTYKGMNCSLADFDRNGHMDVYVSNVHAPLQAEGSLLWMGPDWKNEATKRGALNAHRFGWGAGVADLDWNGWPDLVQANGMVDDTPDKRFEEPRDYWYVNSRLARTGPEVHAYADKWGDLRGYSIWGQERNRVLLNQKGKFHDAAIPVGLEEKGNSRGVALADFDNDGDADLLITHQFKAPSLFRNDLDSDGRNWIGLELKGDGVKVNRDAVNARVEISWGGETQVAEVLNVSGFSAQGDRRLVFGSGGAEGAVDVRVRWGPGLETQHAGLAPNRYHVLEYGK